MSGLTTEQRTAVRACVLAAMGRRVATGSDSSALRALLRTGNVRVAREVEELSASALPGTWTILSETWECRGSYYTARALYRDEHCAALVSGAGELQAHPGGGPAAEDPDVVWLSHHDLARIAEVVR